jgi:hypothetical protein
VHTLRTLHAGTKAKGRKRRASHTSEVSIMRGAGENTTRGALGPAPWVPHQSTINLKLLWGAAPSVSYSHLSADLVHYYIPGGTLVH